MSGLKKASDDLVEISRLGLESSAPVEATITDVEHLASYNWIEASTPTIAVPGSPAYWSAPQGSRSVKKDSGLVYIAQNAARHPDSPLEPLFRSLYIEQPSFDINSIDIVTDRNNIRKLLTFVNPSLNKHGLDPFTIQVDIAAQTAIFCRAETATYEVIGPKEFKGYGHEFEKAYTIDQIKGSTGHHRIVQYKLGGLRFLVRHETDGCVDDLKPIVKKETYDAVKDKLVVKKTEKKKMLPDDLYRRWADVVPAKVSQKISKHKVKSSSDTKAVRTKPRLEESVSEIA
ncbi:geranylgeranyl pyrophosphate synthetase [Penicillium frequentans]|nr:geranylgeranyl pyrophosphate synthetase [Penicillium glabrum]